MEIPLVHSDFPSSSVESTHPLDIWIFNADGKKSQTQLSEHEHESFIWIIFYGTGAHIILQAYFSLIVHVYDFRISETFNFGCHCSCSHVCLCVGGVRARARLRCHTVCTKIPTILPFVCMYAFHVDMLLVEPTKLGRIRTRKIIISLVHCQHAALLSIETRHIFLSVPFVPSSRMN